MNDLQFVTNYRDHATHRRSFNALTRRTYGFDFEGWYRQGCWGESYVPYSFADGNKIVANVSVSLMRLEIDGTPVNAVQLGTVMTDEAYRNRGLSRDLMNIILSEYEDRCNFIYLFANSSVLGFYPKFGFDRVNEYECAVECLFAGPARQFRKLDIDDPRDRAVFYRLIESMTPAGRIGCRYDTGLVMFYCDTVFRDSIFYLPGHDAAVITESRDGVTTIIEIFSPSNIDIDTITDTFGGVGIQKTVFGFTPKQCGSRYVLTPKIDDNDTLFIRSKTPSALPKAMFPVLSKT